MTTPNMVEDVLEGAAQDKTAPSDVLDAAKPRTANGPLLDEADESKVCAAIVALLHEDAPNRRRRRAEWECNRLWLKGVRGARVRRASEDRNAVELVVPLGAFDLPPVMDRTDELLEKVVAHLISDPAVPDAEPATDTDEDKDAAEFTTRLLTVEGSESGYNNQAVVRKALRKAGVYGSGFIYPCVDPQGGGWQPMSVQAHPLAQTKDQALNAPDGQPAPEEALTKRYVAPGGVLTDSAQQADKQWLPKIRPEVLTGEQVVLLPATCTGIGDADGVIIIRWTPLGRLRRLYQDKLGDVTDNAVLQKLVEWRPEDAKFAKPGFMSAKDLNSSASQSDTGKVKDSALVCTLSLYYRSHGQYPKGAYITIGNDVVLHKQTWSGMVETSEGDLREECLDIPLAQFRHFDDDVDDDPYGYGLVRKLGPADEVRGDIVLAWQEYLDNFLHPIPFLPLGSIVQPGQLQARDGTPVYFNPQGKPEWEQAPAFPADGKEFFDRAGQAQDSATLMEEAAQGVDTSSASSGIAKQIVVQQAHVNMSTLRSNAADGQERLWRIITQLIRVFYTVQMKVKYLGEDGAYKEREWSRADLGSTKDIRIARGSFTQLAPEQKQANLDARFAQGLVDAEEYDRLSASNIRATIGYKDNPHRMRVRRQLLDWRDGPPDGWAPVVPQTDPQTGQPLVDATTGQPATQPNPEGNPFADVRPVDEEQDVARIRYLELRREQSSSLYAKKDPAWQQILTAEYLRMRQAAGIQTLGEQQQAQAQAAQQQQQAQADADARKQAAASQQQAAKQTADAASANAEREFAMQMQDKKAQMAREANAMRAQGAPMMPAAPVNA